MSQSFGPDYREIRFAAASTGAPKICYPVAGGCNNTATGTPGGMVKVRIRNTTQKSVSTYELFVDGTSQGSQAWPASSNPIGVELNVPQAAGSYSVTAVLTYTDNTTANSNSIGLTVPTQSGGSSGSGSSTPPAACFAMADGTCPTKLQASPNQGLRIRIATKATGLVATTYTVSVDGTEVINAATWPSGHKQVGASVKAPATLGQHSVQATVGYTTGASMISNDLTLTVTKNPVNAGGGGLVNNILGRFSKGLGSNLLSTKIFQERVKKIEAAKTPTAKVEALINTVGMRFRNAGGHPGTGSGSTTPHICWPQSTGACAAQAQSSGGASLKLRIRNRDTSRTPTSYALAWDGTAQPGVNWPTGSVTIGLNVTAPSSAGTHTLQSAIAYSDGTTEESNTITAVVA